MTGPTMSGATMPGTRGSAASRGRNIIALAGGKGGVGRTWMAVTLAHSLARLGRDTLLFDGDLGTANVDVQLGLMPMHDLGSVTDGKVTLQRAIARYAEGGFDVLAGRSGNGTLAVLPSQQIDTLRHAFAELARTYEWVVLDLGPGVDRNVRLLSASAGITLVVVTDEPTSLADAYAFIKITRASNPLADLRIVVNQTEDTYEGERAYQALDGLCRNYLSFSPPLAGMVRFDLEVREAIRRQMPLLSRAPDSAAGEDVALLAARLDCET